MGACALPSGRRGGEINLLYYIGCFSATVCFFYVRPFLYGVFLATFFSLWGGGGDFSPCDRPFLLSGGPLLKLAHPLPPSLQKCMRSLNTVCIWLEQEIHVILWLMHI